MSVQEYLTSTYHPDCDFVDGVLVERHVGQQDHSNLQGELWGWFRDRRHDLRMKAFVEQRVQIRQGRYRLPDVCVMEMPVSREQVFTQAPFICIEILSPDDSFPRLQERLDDYLGMGVQNVWVLDPATQRGWTITRQGHFEALDGILRTTDGRVVMPIRELFED